MLRDCALMFRRYDHLERLTAQEAQALPYFDCLRDPPPASSATSSSAQEGSQGSG